MDVYITRIEKSREEEAKKRKTKKTTTGATPA